MTITVGSNSLANYFLGMEMAFCGLVFCELLYHFFFHKHITTGFYKGNMEFINRTFAHGPIMTQAVESCRERERSEQRIQPSNIVI